MRPQMRDTGTWRASVKVSDCDADRGQEFECLVLGSFHDFAFTGPFVVDAAEVQYAVDDDSVEFGRVGDAAFLGIGAYGVEADEDVAADAVVLIIVESDDVGVVVVLEVLLVDLEDFVVVAEDVGDVAHLAIVSFGHQLDPCADFPSLYFGH